MYLDMESLPGLPRPGFMKQPKSLYSGFVPLQILLRNSSQAIGFGMTNTTWGLSRKYRRWLMGSQLPLSLLVVLFSLLTLLITLSSVGDPRVFKWSPLGLSWECSVRSSMPPLLGQFFSSFLSLSLALSEGHTSNIFTTYKNFPEKSTPDKSIFTESIPISL